MLHLSCGKPALRRLRDVWLSDSIDFNKFEHLDGREIDLNARATCDSCGEPWMFGIVGNDILAAV